jgi:uncharacterized protein YceK
MNRGNIIKLLAIAGCMLSGCASVVHIEKDEKVDLGKC